MLDPFTLPLLIVAAFGVVAVICTILAGMAGSSGTTSKSPK
jgi:hypothetical protein